jgi:acetyl esterase/lipase
MLLALARCAPVDVLNATVPTSGLTIQHDISYGQAARLKLDVYRPTNAAGLPVVVFIYGGSWNSGSKAMYPFVAATMARRGAVVVVPDYRLYPQVTYPAFLRDCAEAVAWTQAHIAEIGGGGGLFLMGHSAGAYNAAMLGLDPTWLSAAGADPALISGVIGLAGPYDFLPITDPEIVPVFPNAGPDTQPITYAGAGKPPLLLLTGQDDTEVRPRNTAALAARIQAKGGIAATHYYPGLGHIGLVIAIAPILQWRAPVLRDIMAFIHAHAAPPPQAAPPSQRSGSVPKAQRSGSLPKTAASTALMRRMVWHRGRAKDRAAPG